MSLTGKNKSYVTEEISKQLSLQQKDSWKVLDWKVVVAALKKVVTVPANSSRLWEPDELRKKWKSIVGDSGYDATHFPHIVLLDADSNQMQPEFASKHTAMQDLIFEQQKHRDAINSACDKLKIALADLPGDKIKLVITNAFVEKVGSGFLAAIYVSARQWQKQSVTDAGDLYATLKKTPKLIGYRTNGLAPKHQDGQQEEWFRLLVKWVKIGNNILALKYSYFEDGKWHVVFDGETNASAMLMGTSIWAFQQHELC